MTQIRRGLAATLLLLTPALVACGDDSDSTGDNSAEDTSTETADDSASDEESTGESSEEEEAQADLPTIALAELTPTQQALYEDLLLFAPDAVDSREGTSGVSSGSIDGGETSVPVPDGIQVATGYVVTTGPDGGEVVLNTEDGERMEWLDGVVRVAVAADSADDKALLADADALEKALQEWVETNGDAPLVRTVGDSYLLEPGLFDDDAEGEVEVPQSEGIVFYGGPSVADLYSVTLTSESTLQGVLIDQDGRSYLQTYVVKD